MNALKGFTGANFFSGLFSGLFGFREGGAGFKKKPIYAAEGVVAIADRKTVTPEKNIFAEQGTEIFLRGEQWTEFIKALKPTFIIRNATPMTYIEELKKANLGDLQEFGRLVKDSAMQSQEDLG